MNRLPDLSKLTSRELLQLGAGLSVVIAIIVVILASNSSSQTVTTVTVASGNVPLTTTSGSRTITRTETAPAIPPRHRHRSGATVLPPATTSPLSVPKALGQLIIAPLIVAAPPSAALLTAITQGQVGGVLLFGSGLSPQAVSNVAAQLQSAARSGHNPGLLIMTDQEGVGVERIAGPPSFAADQMGTPSAAAQQGAAAGQLLKSAGVNVDLAPVADVSRAPGGFITTEHRSFGSDPAAVASAVCAFADGLKQAGVAYTLKHFPGLGDAIQSTDTVPVSVTEPLSEITADDQAYQKCGHGPLALVMVSSASYTQLTGSTPAVLSPTIYGSVMRRYGIDAVTISDSLGSGALASQPAPALHALNAGLDLLLYAGASDAALAYTGLLADVNSGALAQSRVEDAATKVMLLKASLGLQ